MSPPPVLKVAVNVPLSRLFDYLPPKGVDPARLQAGVRVTVPFGRQQQSAVVMEVADSSELPHSKLKRALALQDEETLLGADDLWLIRFTSEYYHHPVGEVVAAALPTLLRQARPLIPTTEQVVLTPAGRNASDAVLSRRAPKQAELLDALLRRGKATVSELDERLPQWRRSRKALLDKGWIQIDEIADVPPPPGREAAEPGPELNREQRAVLADMRSHADFRVTVLDGVTGSGKTEVYLHRMQDVLAQDKQVLILVPEIGLTPQFVRRLRRRLGIEPLLLHSSLTDNERLNAWRMARDGSAPLLLGTRSAIFTPLARPGLIVVDEEHDSSYKQQEGLRYSARDLAVARAKQLNIPVILGSATPSLETLQRCRQAAYRHQVLSQRAGNAAPPLLRLVDLARYPSNDGLSDPLLRALDKHLGENGQALIFLNRRGFAPTLICGGCGKIAECNRCDARMTVHAARNALHCHHCGARRALDASCSDCGSACRPLGQGTERIEGVLAARYGDESVTRIDSDSTRLKGTMDKALARATSGDARILVGTQMLSKGHHFPKLTLVGVVNADQGLFSTDFRGGERLAQSLTQVAGRAGRERRQGEVIIQTAFASHPFWNRLLSGGYADVADYSLAEREAAAWPPYSRLALIRASAMQRDHTHEFLNAARNKAEQLGFDQVRLLGPVSAPMERRAGRYRAQLLLQSGSRQALHGLLDALVLALESSKSGRRVRWSVDVDPVELF
ncbi:primosomal protein N' [Woeseia oceani]|uniref:Replication restart protein PriA n=1 Tax=Woeseia oceani TaxID=1548547 RepID=A0A193LBM1_9GAMM|nr:primosomal protein N' [Woeseia oceani]ANO49902.1 primosomal protein N' [Woeseia oceani]